MRVHATASSRAKKHCAPFYCRHFRWHSFLVFILGFLIPFLCPLPAPSRIPIFDPETGGGDAQAHVHRHTKQNLQPSDGVMIVVPSACLTKTLTQQLVVYSFALDNRMCSSIRPQIIQCVKIRSCVCVFPAHTHTHTHMWRLCEHVTIHWEERWRSERDQS